MSVIVCDLRQLGTFAPPTHHGRCCLFFSNARVCVCVCVCVYVRNPHDSRHFLAAAAPTAAAAAAAGSKQHCQQDEEHDARQRPRVADNLDGGDGGAKMLARVPGHGWRVRRAGALVDAEEGAERGIPIPGVVEEEAGGRDVAHHLVSPPVVGRRQGRLHKRRVIIVRTHEALVP